MAAPVPQPRPLLVRARRVLEAVLWTQNHQGTALAALGVAVGRGRVVLLGPLGLEQGQGPLPLGQGRGLGQGQGPLVKTVVMRPLGSSGFL
jgi:hypothetical protein